MPILFYIGQTAHIFKQRKRHAVKNQRYEKTEVNGGNDRKNAI